MNSLSRRAFLVAAAAATLAGCSYGRTEVPAGATSPAALSTGIITAEINGTRKRYGAPPLKYNVQLEAAARTHVRLMASRETMSHELGGTLRDRTLAAGYYGAVGENLGEGHKTLEQVIGGWLDSGSHRETLLNRRFTEFGLSAATSRSGKVYWAFITGGPFENWR